MNGCVLSGSRSHHRGFWSVTINNTFVGGTGRYAYHVTGTTLYRYDTLTDSWNQLSQLSGNDRSYRISGIQSSQGYYGKPSARRRHQYYSDGRFDWAVMNGYKIYIYAGTGAGQERTITGIAIRLSTTKVRLRRRGRRA